MDTPVNKKKQILYVLLAVFAVAGLYALFTLVSPVSMYKAQDAYENGFDTNYHRHILILPKHVIVQGMRPSFHSSVLLIDNVAGFEKEYTVRWQYSEGKGVVQETMHKDGNKLVFKGETYIREPIFPAVMTWADLKYKLFGLPFFNGCYYHYCSGW